jgi:hypothetical protein
MENVFGWTPVNTGYIYFNEQGYYQIGDFLGAMSPAKTVSMKVKKHIRCLMDFI